MARGRKPRNWVKLDCEGVLRGSINYLLTLSEQAVWMKMIAYAEVCGGPPGAIQDNEGNGLPREFLAQELHCPVDILESTITKMKSDNAISTNGTGVIILNNFAIYKFSEYDRQKPYREAKKNADKQINKICHSCGYKALTSATECPECKEPLVKDYTSGKLGHMVKQ
jgi:hypothetical protein